MDVCIALKHSKESWGGVPYEGNPGEVARELWEYFQSEVNLIRFTKTLLWYDTWGQFLEGENKNRYKILTGLRHDPPFTEETEWKSDEFSPRRFSWWWRFLVDPKTKSIKLFIVEVEPSCDPWSDSLMIESERLYSIIQLDRPIDEKLYSELRMDTEAEHI